MKYSASRLAGVAVAGALLVPASAHAAKKSFTVCQHGCKYSTIQKAVDASGPGATINVKPGKYVEGVIVKGAKHNGIKIIGRGRKPTDVILEGKDAKGPGGLAQNGVELVGVDNSSVQNVWARNYASNGIFVHGVDTDHPCTGYLFKNDRVSFNRSYGIYAFRCIGGRMTQDVGYGHGDSAYYIGGTPFQDKPVWSYIDHSVGYENVLGYSGTNSKYVDIRNNEFYNNGAGVVPNTLKSEPDQPGTTGIIEENLIYWNNFNYYKANSPVKTVSGGVGIGSFNYPTGVGVILFGVDHWIVKNNSIFGNFKWGTATFSDPTNDTGKALSGHNEFRTNLMGAPFGDLNGVDFWHDGSGNGTCYSDNSAGATFDPGAEPNLILYPACPTELGTGGLVGDPTQDADLLGYASQAEGQEDSWVKHPHPKRLDRKPIDGMEG